MNKLKENETKLTGEWKIVDGKMKCDEVCERISELTENHLKKVTTDESGWETLYRDPDDGRYWELVYPQGEMQSGGPPNLLLVSSEDLSKKYSI